MHRLPTPSRSKSISHVSIASPTLLDLLTPAVSRLRCHTKQDTSVYKYAQRRALSTSKHSLEGDFYAALFQVSRYNAHQSEGSVSQVPHTVACLKYRRSCKRSSTAGQIRRKPDPVREGFMSFSNSGDILELSCLAQPEFSCEQVAQYQQDNQSKPGGHQGKDKKIEDNSYGHSRVWTSLPRATCSSGFKATSNHKLITGKQKQRMANFPAPLSGRTYHTHTAENDSKRRQFVEASRLPRKFFDDVSTLHIVAPALSTVGAQTPTTKTVCHRKDDRTKSKRTAYREPLQVQPDSTPVGVDNRLKLLASVRELEGKLERARKELARSMTTKIGSPSSTNTVRTLESQPPIILTKDDYKNLVDLYYYSHNSRFSPESTDESPTPLILDDYSFTLSADFSTDTGTTQSVNEDEIYESPLKQIEEMLKQRQLREIAVMQVFVDLLLDDYSSNRALYEAYKQFPDPGVAYLPMGIVRLFLQRMSTPWTVSEKSMLRYLSLIDDMQKAKIPLAVSEWSSAVYLAGRAFSKVTQQDVKHSFGIWQSMEREAGVKASHVTFNILFDIAVRSGRFALGETILKEMHSRNLRLNRLGRVSLMYYHGLRKDGDGVRKAYRDFVEAGEIVDTLVLNCVIASLLNAQEPQAAEQVYARMKNMQSKLRKGINRDGDEVLYKRYPDPGTNTIGEEMASNHIGRILQKAPRLQRILPESHTDLQAQMPLTPDHVTFRSMIAYHATTSGDLDRLTVLLQDMTDFFRLPLHTITFQLLFKGFAIHGPIGGPHSAWSSKRLDMCWNACREAIKQSQAGSQTGNISLPQSVIIDEPAENETSDVVTPTLPSIRQINAIPLHGKLPDFNPPLSRPPPRRLSDWAEFVLDLAAFPRERLKRLERFHSTMFDAEDMNKPHEKTGVHTFRSPFFQSVAYTAPEPQLDTEEGEYELPNPSESGLVHKYTPASFEPDTGASLDPKDDLEQSNPAPRQVVATRALVCWLLRAYARITKSRTKVEEIWGQVRKVFKPLDAVERESVVRVLRRCLRDCDREGSD